MSAVIEQVLDAKRLANATRSRTRARTTSRRAVAAHSLEGGTVERAERLASTPLPRHKKAERFDCRASNTAMRPNPHESSCQNLSGLVASPAAVPHRASVRIRTGRICNPLQHRFATARSGTSSTHFVH